MPLLLLLLLLSARDASLKHLAYWGCLCAYLSSQTWRSVVASVYSPPSKYPAHSRCSIKSCAMNDGRSVVWTPPNKLPEHESLPQSQLLRDPTHRHSSAVSSSGSLWQKRLSWYLVQSSQTIIPGLSLLLSSHNCLVSLSFSHASPSIYNMALSFLFWSKFHPA